MTKASPYQKRQKKTLLELNATYTPGLASLSMKKQYWVNRQKKMGQGVPELIGGNVSLLISQFP